MGAYYISDDMLIAGIQEWKEKTCSYSLMVGRQTLISSVVIIILGLSASQDYFKHHIANKFESIFVNLSSLQSVYCNNYYLFRSWLNNTLKKIFSCYNLAFLLSPFFVLFLSPLAKEVKKIIYKGTFFNQAQVMGIWISKVYFEK